MKKTVASKKSSPKKSAKKVVRRRTNTRKKALNKKQMTILGCVVAVIVVGLILFLYTKQKEKSDYENLPIKVDISMTSYYGSIDYILDYFDLDFDLVTMGANCYTGVQKGEFTTEKYGVLHTEFRYCKSNKTTIFRIYNDESDQKLRDPEDGELPTFDKYGKKQSSSNTSTV